jgi:hypothetical protein
MPIDFEIFLAEENHKLYEDPAAKKKLFDQTVPAVHFLETLFRSRGMPYIPGLHTFGCTYLISKSFRI